MVEYPNTQNINWVSKWVLRNQHNYDTLHDKPHDQKTFPVVLAAWKTHSQYKINVESQDICLEECAEALKDDLKCAEETVNQLIQHLKNLIKSTNNYGQSILENSKPGKSERVQCLKAKLYELKKANKEINEEIKEINKEIKKETTKANNLIEEASKQFEGFLGSFKENILETLATGKNWKSCAFICYCTFFNLHNCYFIDKQKTLKDRHKEILWSLCFDCKLLIKNDVVSFSAAIAGIEAISNGIPTLECSIPVDCSSLAAIPQQSLVKRPDIRLTDAGQELENEQIKEGKNFLCTLNFSILKTDQASVEHLDPWHEVAEVINFLTGNFFSMSQFFSSNQDITIAGTVTLEWGGEGVNRYMKTKKTDEALENIFKNKKNFLLASIKKNSLKRDTPSIEYFRDKPLGNLIADRWVYRNSFFNESNGKLLAELYRDWLKANEFFYFFLRCSQNEKDIGTVLLEFANLISKFRRCASEDGSGENEYYILSKMCDVPTGNDLKNIFKTQEFDLEKENNPDLKKASLGEEDKKVWANMYSIFQRIPTPTVSADEDEVMDLGETSFEDLH